MENLTSNNARRQTANFAHTRKEVITLADLKLTTEQQAAVDTRGCSLLVTAAAGSGKTAVLVRRILEQICDDQNPADITDFLVVTFTRAAAGEMREKMTAALMERLALQPGNRRLMRQLALLPHASFETIDSFYYRLVQQHTDRLPLSPSARIATDTELELLQEQVLNELLEEYYAQGDEAFLQAVEYFSASRDDTRFVEAVRRLRERLSALPNAAEWLTRQVELYKNPPVWGQRPYARTLQSAAELQVDYARTLLTEACSAAAQDEVLAAKYLPALQQMGQDLEELSRAVSQDFDRAAEQLKGWSFPRFAAARGADEAKKAQVAALRDEVKDCIAALREDIYFLTTREADADAAALCGVVEVVAGFVQSFERRYLEAKTARRLLDFSDLSHYAFSLLVEHYDESGGQHTPTALAQALSRQYREILVDEYQDTNRLQDAVFSCLSNQGRNLFLVGDAKQSIYLFRQAEPRIFVDKKQAFAPVSQGGGAARRRLSLNKNFRSTRSVVSFVNTLFGATMEPVLGGFSYGEEQLQFGAVYDPAQDVPVEVTLLVDGEEEQDGGEPESGFEAEAAAVTQRICALLAEGTVLDRDGVPRPIRPRDIVVLLRTVKNRAARLEQMLTQAGVPVYADSTDSFFVREEISTALSYLQILDNPLQDVHVVAVLRSPLYGVTADELARIRLALEEEAPFYRCVQAMRERLPKAARFLEDLETLRRIAQQGSVERLLTALLERTGYPAMAAAMPQGELRCANLRLLQRYAAEFEQTAHKGLFRFNRYLDGLRRSGRDLPAAKQAAEHSDVVRIMSIHKSKGLEFPVVILCDMDHRFNLQDQNERLLLHNEVGIGLKLRDNRRLVEYDTLQRAAVRHRLHLDSVAEELRCLYVAVTRAQQRLLLFANARGRGSTVHKLEQVCLKDGAVHPAQLLAARSPAKLLLLALQTTRQGEALCRHYSLPSPEHPAEGHCTVTLLTPTKQQPSAPYRQRALEAGEGSAPIPDLAAQLTPVGTAATALPAKLTVTRLKDTEILPSDDLPQGDRLLAYRRQHGLHRPRFVAEQGIATPAEAGTAMHELVQFAFLHRLKSDPLGEIAHLVEHGFLTERQQKLISMDRLRSFTDSPLFHRMMQAEALQRELKFTVLCKASELMPEVEVEAAEEELLLQGVIDCVMKDADGVTLIDFKTDRVVNGKVLADRYCNQLRLYKLAYRRMTGEEVRRCVIYSFGLGREIEVEFSEREMSAVD